jgi:uncharacterized protein YggE
MLHKLLVATALLLPLAAPASQLPEYPFIHVVGNGSTYVIPDIGAIDFEVAASATDPAAARTVIETRIADIRALMETHGLALDAMEVRNVRQELRKPQPGESVQVYDLKCVVHIKVTELVKWSGFASGLVGMPNLDAFATAFDTTEHDKVEASLSLEAIKDARGKAEALVAGFGRKLGPVSGVTTGTLKNLSAAMGLVRADYTTRRDERAALVDRNNIVNVIALPLSQSVDVIFRIK